ncbi:hypothetical protein [Actinacidiphila sp. ITFR-21]|uniref:hypothetical protein n=1 Tax=Actinacidiphila sp. ITFR-21 TaxID=3075199 RepID=UPI00288A8F20|nr:hypothetical protein [Streptomyces sp. ITFR-21]WNI15337.1 hypothetical protein RLT57_07200 [Streptomyces sp. ITFR-21]
MSTGAIIAVIVAVVVVIAIVAAVTLMRGGGTGGVGLKRRFGPEYERTLAQHDGDDKATREELTERVKRYGGIERQPVDAQQRERYGQRWAEIQARFVDRPGQALQEADRLTAEVAAERGFPAADSPEHFDALSVHHPYQVQGYRQAHALTARGEADGREATEDMRQALVAARALFDEMLRGTGTRPAVGGRATATGPAAAQPAPDAPAGPAERTPVADQDTAVADQDTTGTAAGRDAGTDAAADANANGNGNGNGGGHHRSPTHRLAALTGTRHDRSTDDHS